MDYGTHFNDLVKLMAKLRSPDGCPWDKEQTHESLKPYLIEETYEVIDTIDAKDNGKLNEELADLLFQIIFHCQIASENNAFNIGEVLKLCLEKMTRRHPHVFGDKNLQTAEEVLKQWHEIKKSEEGYKDRKSIVDGLPKHLPALQKAQKLQKKVARVGFDWQNVEEVLAKVEEELAEVKAAIKEDNKDSIMEELGDLLFAVVSLARFLKLESENVLHKTIYKFVERFKKIETELAAAGKDIEKATLKEMDELWNKIKKSQVKSKERLTKPAKR